MGQLFPPGADWIVKWSMLGGAVTAVILVGVSSGLYWSPIVTDVNVAKDQPIPFSHHRHVTGNDIDCRYCHTTVETSNFAGIPTTETCMTCHSQILADQPMLEPIFESWSTGKPMEWTRLNDMPDFVYFDHSIHINKGIGCNHCHSNDQSRIEEMRLTVKAQTHHMSWCLECHKDPSKFIRPQSEVFNMAWNIRDDKSKTLSKIQELGFDDQHALGNHLVKEYKIEVEQLTNCSICHR